MIIGNCVNDYGINKARHTLAARILEDLKEGRFTPLADEATVVQHYGRFPSDSAWQQFLRACRAYSTLNGCVVLVDDTNRCFVESADIHGEYDFEFMKEFACRSATIYRDKLRELGKRGSVLLTVYRLPRADYERFAWSHFGERGEYVGELKVELV